MVSTEQPAAGDTDYRISTVSDINRTTSNRRYRLQNLHRAWYQQNNQQQRIQTTESAPCVYQQKLQQKIQTTEYAPATGDTDYIICTVRGINSNSIWRYRLQSLHHEQEIQTTESAPCVVSTEPATEDTDYRICTSNRRYRLHNLHRAWYQQNHQQKIPTTELAPCVVSTEPATEDTDYRINTVRGINRTTSNRRYRLQNQHRAWYQQNNQQHEIQTTESAPCVA